MKQIYPQPTKSIITAKSNLKKIILECGGKNPEN